MNDEPYIQDNRQPQDRVEIILECLVHTKLSSPESNANISGAEQHTLQIRQILYVLYDELCLDLNEKEETTYQELMTKLNNLPKITQQGNYKIPQANPKHYSNHRNILQKIEMHLRKVHRRIKKDMRRPQ